MLEELTKLSVMKKRKYTLYVLMLLSWSLVGFTWGDILARKTAKGNELFEAGKYDEALQAFTEADVNSKAGDPRLPRLYMNMGNTLVKQGNPEQAAAMYQKAFEASDKAGFKADVQYNSGNAWFRQQQYQQALESYEHALELNPQHLQAQQNKAIVEQLVEQQQEQQEQEQEQEQNGENNEEQQNQDQQQSQNQEEEQKPEEEQQEDQEQEQQNQEQNEERQAAEAQESEEDKEQELSKEEALRILDALKEKEQLRQQPVQIPPRPVEKDW